VKDHLDAIKTLLETTGRDAYIGDVDEDPSYPYFLIWAPAGSPGYEYSVDSVRTDLEAMVGVTSVGATPDAAFVGASLARGVLATDGQKVVLDVDGRAAWLRLVDSRPLEVDRDVTLTATNSHPSYLVDMYRLVSTPADDDGS
jgi:hypothetical protein